MEALPRTLATQFDIDAPTDLAVLALTGAGGPRLREHLATLDARPPSLSPRAAAVPRPGAQILVAGRVGSTPGTYLERETACRVRLFAEERGMEADGRATDGNSALAPWLPPGAVGLERFFATLAELGDAAFIDTRVLLAHKRIDASREDRFLSDLGRPGEASRDPFLREFTQRRRRSADPGAAGRPLADVRRPDGAQRTRLGAQRALLTCCCQSPRLSCAQ